MVNYEGLDPFKRLCQDMGRRTAVSPYNLDHFGVIPREDTRGESVYLLEFSDHFIGIVDEGLGTKNLAADAVNELLQGNTTYYDAIAQDTVAMIVNDMITLGLLPLAITMHLSLGTDNWLTGNPERAQELAMGWAEASIKAGCVWGGGETPSLKGIIHEGTADIKGSAVGMLRPKEFAFLGPPQVGDHIVGFPSTGIGANGLTDARTVGAKGLYQEILSNGQMYGEALLEPTAIYVGDIFNILHSCELVEERIVNYTANITGHGHRKIMRHPEPRRYVLDELPEPHPLFKLIQQELGYDDRKMYGTFNMGLGFVLFVPEKWVDLVYQTSPSARSYGRVLDAPPGQRSSVELKPLGLTFEAESLGVR